MVVYFYFVCVSYGQYIVIDFFAVTWTPLVGAVSDGLSGLIDADVNNKDYVNYCYYRRCYYLKFLTIWKKYFRGSTLDLSTAG